MKALFHSTFLQRVCSCLLLLGLLFAFPLNVSAEEGTITTIDMDYRGIVVNDDSVADGEDISDEVSVYTFSGSHYYNGMICYEFPLTDDTSTRLICMLDVANDFSFNSRIL